MTTTVELPKASIPVGLSTVVYLSMAGGERATRPRPLTVRRWRNGSSLRVKGERGGPGVVPRKTRGRIGGFSKDSQKRLRDFFAQIDQGKAGLPKFITLTYPGKFSPDSDRWKRDLDVFLRRLETYCPSSYGVWKLEPQRRGAPHFHIVVWQTPFIENAWLGRVWYEIVGSGDGRHQAAGTSVAGARTWRGVTSYCAKYITKLCDLPEENGEMWVHPGRWWGKFRKDRFPREYVDEQLNRAEYARMLRPLRRKRYGTRAQRRGHPALRRLRMSAAPLNEVCPEYMREREKPKLDGLHVFMSEAETVRLIAWARGEPYRARGRVPERGS